jgi:hypothetical protein
MDVEQRVLELEKRLEFQQKLCNDLQHALLFETKQQPQNDKRKYNKATPLKEFIQTNLENESMLKPLVDLCHTHFDTEPSMCLLRAYLSMYYKNEQQNAPAQKRVKSSDDANTRAIIDNNVEDQI